MNSWIPIARVDDIPVLGSRCVQRERGLDVAVFRNAQDEVFALLDRCPHKGGPLSQGIVFGTSVACPLHNWTIGLDSGCAKAPDEGCTPRFAVKVEDGVVHLDVQELASHATEFTRPIAGPARRDLARVRAFPVPLRSGSGPHPNPLPEGEGVKSTCPYCGVGCGVIIETEGTRITGVRGDPDHPANFGRLCTKGQTLHLTASPAITQQTRLLQPLRRLERGGPAQALGWDAALDLATDRFASVIEQHGPDAVGFYISGQLLTEDYYVFNKLAKGLIGTNNVDTNSRLCMSSAVAGYKLTLGADAPPACYDDVNHASCLFIVGSNAAFAHPVLFR
eukprot:gene39215-51645_t